MEYIYPNKSWIHKIDQKNRKAWTRLRRDQGGFLSDIRLAVRKIEANLTILDTFTHCILTII